MTKQEKIQNRLENTLDDLHRLLTDRILELHKLAGAEQGQFYQGARHTFCYYRDFVSEAQMLLHDLKVK